MNLNKTMQHLGLAGTGVIALLLIVVVYYLDLIVRNTSLEGFGVGAQLNAESRLQALNELGQGESSLKEMKRIFQNSRDINNDPHLVMRV